MPFGIGPLELIIVLAIILLAFGAKRLPEIGKNLGSGMREFKKGVTGDKEDADEKVSAAVAAEPTLPHKTDEKTPAA